MLQALDASIAICLERAYHAREQAAQAIDETDRAFWSAMAQKWQDLADGYEFQQRLDRWVRPGAESGGAPTAVRA
jgi:hypothetical protein